MQEKSQGTDGATATVANHNITIISAGAGSGKTYRLTEELVRRLRDKEVRAGGIIATTFTKKAAAELQERVRVKLLEEGLTEAADELTHALIGTVHGLGVKLLKRFAYEAGVSPQVSIIADEDHKALFNESLSTVLTTELVREMADLTERLGFEKNQNYRKDWRDMLHRLTETARVNGFDDAVLEESRRRSIESFLELLGPEDDRTPAEWATALRTELSTAIDGLRANTVDATKGREKLIAELESIRRELQLRGRLFWYDWARLTKLKPTKKSAHLVEGLESLANDHTGHVEFRKDIVTYVNRLFGTAREAISEYQRYKQRRGLIDYTDMEVLLNKLLHHPEVRAVLSEELDLLMVDEFQDTSPMQLALFWQLSQLAKQSVWVGDPKQSIYGFRGAEPRLMRAIVEAVGGVREENILKHSWRSREEIVAATNAIFTKAFYNIPAAQVALQPKRRAKAGPDTMNKQDEPEGMGPALHHWHYQPEAVNGKAGRTNQGWLDNSLAQSIQTLLRRAPIIEPKDGSGYRPLRAGDIAVLTRSNKGAGAVADALHRAGLKAAISRNGLLRTAEVKLVLACLKFMLFKADDLSKAEILLLAGDRTLEEILNDRLEYLRVREADEEATLTAWASEEPIIRQLNELRDRTTELSSAELLRRLVSELDLRRLVMQWGNPRQRLANLDVLRKLAIQYEENCNRLHTAASTGGWLLYLNSLENDARDAQGSGESPDAVNVLTYHKSKGLEWPVVICYNLEQSLRDEVWGLALQQTTDTVDLDNILGNRWLRLWVNPYSDQASRTTLLERISESGAKQAATGQALEEEARLLYVGITRARDYLVFPSRDRKAMGWLNRVYHHGDESATVLDPHSSESPWEYGDRFLHVETEVSVNPPSFPVAERTPEPVHYWEKRKGVPAEAPPRYRIDWKREPLPTGVKLRAQAPEEYLPPPVLFDPSDAPTVYRTLRYFLLADRPTDTPDARTGVADHYRRQLEAEAMVPAEDLLAHGEAYAQWLTGLTGQADRQRDYQLRMEHQGRLFQVRLDSLVEGPETVYAFHAHPLAKGEATLTDTALEYGTRLYYSRRALERLFPGKQVRQWVWWPLLGQGMEVG